MKHILQITIFGSLITATLTVSLKKIRSKRDVGESFGGDMHLSEEQFEELFSPARNGLISTKYRWPNKTVPYELSMNHTQDQHDYIERALKTIESVSCVRFVRRTTEMDYIEITADEDGCHSMVGFHGGRQILNLENDEIGVGCFRKMAILHEFLHGNVLGFHHMQSVYNRDKYVTIHWENIQPGLEDQFMKFSNSEVTFFNISYDYLSVMHYGAYYFSKNGKPTIVPTVMSVLYLMKYKFYIARFNAKLLYTLYKDEKYLNVIGNAINLSGKDIQRLNAMYECNSAATGQ